jgi:hypothetical protein
MGGVEVYLHTFLNSALDGGEWSFSCPQEAGWASEPV